MKKAVCIVLPAAIANAKLAVISMVAINVKDGSHAETNGDVEMKRVTVTSSNILAIGYDEVSKELEVEFKNGWVYRYFNISPALDANLMSASSHGSFLDAYVKKAGYAFRRIR